MPATAFSQIGQIASMRAVHEAFQWLHLQGPQIMHWQRELVAIPAPPFAEQARAAWLLDRFHELGLEHAHIDEAGNTIATLSGALSKQTSAPLVLLSAHIDTVFPATTPLAPLVEGTRLSSPGACDNGAGVSALLAIAAALLQTGLRPDCDIVFVGNVGEEGEGNLRGMRHIYQDAPWSRRIAAHLVLDGAGHEVAVTTALGSRRFLVEVHGSGGHSWTDAGRPNPIAALCTAIATMSDRSRKAALEALDEQRRRDPSGAAHPSALQPLASSCVSPGPPATIRSAWNVGSIEGGGAVNAIPERAAARFDLRSTDTTDLVRLEVELHRAIEDAVLTTNTAAEASGSHGHALSFTLESIGNRPAGGLVEGARILELLRGVDRHLNLRTECRTASTDANIPLSLGIEAISIGAGGDGGGIHTRGEWYDARGRDLGLRRILLLLVALATPAETAAG